MGPRVEALSGRLLGAAGEVGGAGELGRAVSELLGPVVPHDGYLLVGRDPVTGAGCFLAEHAGYGLAARRQLAREHATARPEPVRRLGPGSTGERFSGRLRDLMAADGIGHALRLAATDGTDRAHRVDRGELVLLRGADRPAFSAADAECCRRLAGPLAGAVRRFVTGMPLRPFRCGTRPRVLIVAADDTIQAVSPGTRDELDAGTPLHEGADLATAVCTITYRARRDPAAAITRIPTRHGWMVMQAQPLEPVGTGQVVITVQPAAGRTLLPAVAAWYGLTARERGVVAHVLDGRPVKQIARHLGVSAYTVNDHLKAVYRKTAVRGRDELAACLSW